jgi:hypothetical protein
MWLVDLVRRIGRYVGRLARRGREILRDGGWLQFAMYVKEEVILNSYLTVQQRSGFMRGEDLSCPICGYSSSRFMTHVGAGYVVRNAICPRCGSYPRHRGFAVLLENHLRRRLEQIPQAGGHRLLFAPESSMKDVLSEYVTGLEGVDLNQINDLVAYREDIMNLGFADNSVEFLSCFHVVEHVPDDLRAMTELRRVLHPRGIAILNVPITFGRWDSIAFGYPNPLLNDHFYDYGEDFSVKVATSGLSGVGYRLSNLVAPDVFQRMALQDELIYVLEKSEIPGQVNDHDGNSLTHRASSND